MLYVFGPGPKELVVSALKWNIMPDFLSPTQTTIGISFIMPVLNTKTIYDFAAYLPSSIEF